MGFILHKQNRVLGFKLGNTEGRMVVYRGLDVLKGGSQLESGHLLLLLAS
jgi:hypothetical protein